jgi:hypothetical protein
MRIPILNIVAIRDSRRPLIGIITYPCMVRRGPSTDPGHDRGRIADPGHDRKRKKAVLDTDFLASVIKAAGE